MPYSLRGDNSEVAEEPFIVTRAVYLTWSSERFHFVLNLCEVSFCICLTDVWVMELLRTLHQCWTCTCCGCRSWPRGFLFSVFPPVSTAGGLGAQSKTHSPPCAISSASSLHFSLKSTCFSNLPACQDQLFQYGFLNSSLSCSVSDLPEIT